MNSKWLFIDSFPVWILPKCSMKFEIISSLAFMTLDLLYFYFFSLIKAIVSLTHTYNCICISNVSFIVNTTECVGSDTVAAWKEEETDEEEEKVRTKKLIIQACLIASSST